MFHFRRITKIFFIALGAVAFQPMKTEAAESEKARYWEPYPQSPGGGNLTDHIAEDPNGRIWIMCGNKTSYWDPSAKNWSSIHLNTEYPVSKLYGGTKTGLYATEPIKLEEDKSGAKPILKANVFLLDSGDPKFVTQIVYDYNGGALGFHVLGRDRFLNWSNGKIRIYDKGKWHSFKADVHQYGPRLFESDGFVSLLHKGKLYIIGAENKIKVIDLDPKIMAKPKQYSRLGKRTVVLCEPFASSVQAFDILTGKQTELKDLNAMIAGRSIESLNSTPDGCLWVSVNTRDKKYPDTIRVTPDCIPSMYECSAGPEWPFKTECTTVDADGTYWCMAPKCIIRMSEGKVQQFDSRIDGSPAGTSASYKGNDGSGIFCDSRGIIYVGGERGVFFAYNQGESLTGAKPFRPIDTAQASEPAWRTNQSHSSAWCVGDTIFYHQYFERTITAISAANSKQLFTMKLENGNDYNDLWIAAAEVSNRVLICTKEKIFTVDSKSGEILATAITKHYRVAPPICVDKGYIVPRGYEGDTIAKLKSDGTQIWERKLSDEPHRALIQRIGLLILQARPSSSRGLTFAMDAETGEIIWEKKSDDYGVGVAFLKDPTHMVESNFKTQIVCRESITGEQVWSYVPERGLSYQAPIVDTTTDRIYTSQEDGTILCLEGKDGKLAWKSSIPTSPARSHTGMTHIDFNGMLMLRDNIAVVGSDGNLYVLDAKNGNLLRRVKILDDVIENGIRTGIQHLSAGPWVNDDHLIIPSFHDIKSYPLKAILD